MDVAFPNLDTLKLSSLNLNKIWEDNQHSVHKLTNLIVESCDGLKHLFSSSMVGSFPNLVRLEISDCHMMEEIIAAKERNNNIVALEEVRFFKLETIILKDMKNLKTIWHNQFDTLKMLQVKSCQKITVVFPSSMQKAYHNLETLVVTNCALVEEIFELTSNENCNIEDTTQLKSITLENLPKLKLTWSRDPQGIISFHNLENVFIEYCENLEYLFPLSVATSCLHLQELFIKWCGNIKDIVAQKKGSTSTATIFEFNHLSTLVLWSLHKLRGFYAGNHTLVCPSLRTIDISICENLNLFRTLSTSSHERLPDGKLDVLVQQSPLVVEQVIPNLEHLRINQQNATEMLQAQNIGALFNKISFLGLSQFEDEDSTFPDWFLQNVYTMKWLLIEWSSLKKIFQDERPVNGKSHVRLKKLTLHRLPELQHICEEGFQIDPVLEVLEFLRVVWCSSMINLGPSSVSFIHLTNMVVKNCNGMINLISSSTARSLAKLARMKVTMCSSLEEIIAQEGDEKIYDIAFLSLEILILECLPRLYRFCSQKFFLRFPLLKVVVVRECARMKNFSEGGISTPKLRKVITTENDKEWHWKGDLNGTIKNMFGDKVAFYRFKHLTFSEYPELKDFWYGNHHHNMFGNLRSLVVQRCDFLSDVLFPSNLLQVLHVLEDLEVRDCGSLETVFDVKDMNSKGMLVKQTSRLKRLTLSTLPKLKHIWNTGHHRIISFGNLCIVGVVECQSLLNLFPLSLCQDLRHLEELSVESCGVGEIVSMEEESIENNFSFPHLSYLRLIRLEKLKGFYMGKHTLECPALKTLNLYRCEALQMFAFNHLDLQRPHQVEEIHDMPVSEAFFSIEKVSPNLEELALNGKDAMMIFHGHCEESMFAKVEILRIECFHETQITFWNEFLEIFPNLVTLQVRNSSVETLFLREGIVHCSTEIAKQVRKLWLYELEHLRHIWHEESPLDQLAPQNLEDLSVVDCPSLISLVPSSMSFHSLKELHVDRCKGLVYLITSSIAKSLKQLTTLKVKNCQMMQDVLEIGEEAEEEIIFENLEYLKFSSLPRMRSFCWGKPAFIFPSLLRFVVRECPQMKIFSSGAIIAPLLTKIEVENKRKRWKNDLNTTIGQLFIDKQSKWASTGDLVTLRS